MGMTLLNKNGTKGRIVFNATPSTSFAPNHVPLLDVYPGASVAYSLRKLNSNYPGPAIRVRRSSDNSERDIGFSSNYLDTNDLISFAQGSDVYVVTWYNQSPDGSGFYSNARNAVQATMIRQPIIFQNNSFYLDSGLPSIRFNNHALGLTSTAVPTNSNFSIFLAIRNQSRGNNNQIFVTRDSNGAFNITTNGFNIFNSSLVGVSNLYLNLLSLNNYLISAIAYPQDAYVNNAKSTLTTTYTNPASGQSAVLGMRNDQAGTTWFNGFFNEFIAYTSDKSSDLEGIQSNINNLYSLY